MLQVHRSVGKMSAGNRVLKIKIGHEVDHPMVDLIGF